MKLSIKNLTKTYNSDTILDQVSFEITKGEVLSIIGPSGAGKSTLLRCISGLEKIDAGTVIPLGIKVGLVFQGFNLFANKTVIQNVALAPMLVDGLTKDEAYQNAKDLLKKVKLGDKLNAYPSALSGGQMQRVAIARALARNPEVLLFDEPTSALDPELTYEVLEVIKELVASGSLSVIIVTHEINFAKRISDRMIFMENGKKMYEGTTEFVLSQNRVSQFLDKIY